VFSRNIGVMASVVVAILMVTNFILAFHTEHNKLRQKLKDDKWLVEKCKDPEFFIKFKQHSDLCEDVERTSQKHVLLHCFVEAFQRVELCGFVSCQDLMSNIIDSMSRAGMATIIMVFCLIFFVPLLAMYLCRFFLDIIAEQHLRNKYNKLYGANGTLTNENDDMSTLTHFHRRHPMNYVDMQESAHLNMITAP